MDGDDTKIEEIRQYDPPAHEKRKNALISMFYVVVLVLCGLPMWVATTTTYRATLPESDMALLATTVLDITVEVNLVDMTGELGLAGLREVRDSLLKRLEQLTDSKGQVRLRYIVGPMRESSRAESVLLGKAKTAGELQTMMFDLEGGRERGGGIRVLLLPEDTLLLAHDKDVLIARGPANVPPGDPLALVLVRTRSANQATQALTVTIGRVLASQDRLQHAYQAVLEVPAKSKLSEMPKRVRSLLTRVHSASRYEWVFSLIVPQPLPTMSDEVVTSDKLRSPDHQQHERSPEWDFPRWEHLYLEPLVRQLGAFVAVRVSSQHVYGVRPPPSAGASRGSSRDNDRLTRLVNGLEAYLGGASPSQLHMVVVAPTCRTASPSSTEQQRQEAFTVPGWGAVLLLGASDNSSSSGCSLQLPVDGAVAMTELLPRLLALMGLSEEPLEPIRGELLGATGFALEYERAGDQPGTPLAGWQLQCWLRERAVENLAVTRTTLRSLLVLLDRVVTMVIRDEVASHVRTATERGLFAMQALQDGALPQAFLASRQALQAAETAFFHPSLLELLYFQDDQKIGIYIPLFVPVLVPLVLGAAKVLWPLIATYLRRPVHAKRD